MLQTFFYPFAVTRIRTCNSLTLRSSASTLVLSASRSFRPPKFIDKAVHTFATNLQLKLFALLLKFSNLAFT